VYVIDNLTRKDQTRHIALREITKFNLSVVPSAPHAQIIEFAIPNTANKANLKANTFAAAAKKFGICGFVCREQRKDLEFARRTSTKNSDFA
jgi:hypothetical protein